MRISDLSSDMCSSDLPAHYDIAVTPDAKALTFTGRVAIDLDLFESSTIITMNALDLAFTSASIAKAGNSDAEPLTVTVDAAAQHRSEACRVGKECVRTLRSGWLPSHEKK